MWRSRVHARRAPAGSRRSAWAGHTLAFGARTYRPNSRGKVYMIMESYLYEENPEVEIPDKAKMNVLPASPEEIEEIRSR